MIQISRTLVLLTACISITGASWGQEDRARDNRATVTIYRPNEYYGSIGSWKIMCDGKALTDIRNNQSIEIEVAPGPHTLAAMHKSPAQVIDYKSGERYFFRYNILPGALFTAHLSLTQVTEGQAKLDTVHSKVTDPKVYMKSPCITH